MRIKLFPFRFLIATATEYFGGIEMSVCTWSGIPKEIVCLRESTPEP